MTSVRRQHGAKSKAACSLLCGALAVGITLCACEREDRPFRVQPPAQGSTEGVRLTSLQPGVPQLNVPVHNEYEENAWALAEGKRLFVQFNCNGCHANGGGGMGPALMDHKWIYGSNPEQIFSTIMEGRPNGMPSFKNKVPAHQAWQLAAYVRSMSGLVPFTAAPNRNDDLDPVVDPENSREEPLDPKQSFVPPAAEMPL